jgi:thiosulfate/3-mercaptopyruvate sulfurtransferase
MAARSRSFAAPSPSIGVVVPAWLEPRLGAAKLRLLDVRIDPPSGKQRARSGLPSVYARGHIPGSVPFDVATLLFDDTGVVVSAPEVAIAMSSAFVGDDHTVIFIDEGPSAVALSAARVLLRYGHHDVHVLEGGFARWLGEGRAVSRELVRHPPASFTARNPS